MYSAKKRLLQLGTIHGEAHDFTMQKLAKLSETSFAFGVGVEIMPALEEIVAMSRVCQVTGKRPMSGNNVSHAYNRTKRRFHPNLHRHRFWLESEKRFVKLKVSAAGMRIIDKKGIEDVVVDLRRRGEKV